MRQERLCGTHSFSLRRVALATFALCMFGMFSLRAQNPELRARLAEVKESIARNKQQLAHYTWTEQDIISLKGDEKKEELFQVQLGPDGKPQKTNLDPNMSDDERRRRGLRARIREKKIEEYKEYVGQMKGLMQEYVPPQESLLDRAYQQGNLMIGPAGVPNEIRLVLTNYLKPQDSVTLVFDRQQKRLLTMNISSYLDDPSNAVKLNIQFSALPDGTNHVSGMTLDGVGKQLTIAVTNTNYEKL
ncbi:MAG TPA: hypothetical protein VMU53_07970 [Candidatus Sulfotelmatobacter sp.]|nr:hypothetical protein [Candidatus Sulfotelmatobacter sp.]